MFEFHSKPISLMVLFAIVLHYVWSVALFVDDSALHATALSAIHRWLGLELTVVGVPTAATLAIVAMVIDRPWFVLLLIPQQLLLTMSAAGAIEAIWISQFADGVFRSRGFIVADQCYSIIAAIWHTVAIVCLAWGRYGKRP